MLVVSVGCLVVSCWCFVYGGLGWVCWCFVVVIVEIWLVNLEISAICLREFVVWLDWFCLYCGALCALS